MPPQIPHSRKRERYDQHGTKREGSGGGAGHGRLSGGSGGRDAAPGGGEDRPGGDPQGHRQRRLHHHICPGGFQGAAAAAPEHRPGAAGPHGPGGELLCLRGDRGTGLSELPPQRQLVRCRLRGGGERGHRLRHRRPPEGAEDHGGIRLRQPHGPHAHGQRPGRRAGRHPGQRAGGVRRRRDERVLRERRGPPDRQVRSLHRGPVSPDHPGRGRGALPGGRIPGRGHQGPGPGLL